MGLAGRFPDRFGSLRTRLALLYSIVLFALAAVMVGGIYLGLSRALSEQPTSHLARFEQLAQEGSTDQASLSVDQQEDRPWLVIFEEEVNRRALERLRAYSFTALAGVFLGLLTGAVVSVLLLLTRRAGWRTAIPFGPPLLTGAVLALALGGVPPV